MQRFYSVKWKKNLEIEKLRNNNKNNYFNSYRFSTSDNTVVSKV